MRAVSLRIREYGAVTDLTTDEAEIPAKMHAPLTAAMMPRTGRRRVKLAAWIAVVAGVVATLCGCSDIPSPVGQPDPGGHILAGLTPVLSAVPHEARVVRKYVVEPQWANCGTKSSWAWNQATVDVAFNNGTSSWKQIVASIRTGMTRLGWTYDGGPVEKGPWTWHREIEGKTAAAMLLGGPGTLPPYPWDFQADADAAVRPIQC